MVIQCVFNLRANITKQMWISGKYSENYLVFLMLNRLNGLWINQRGVVCAPCEFYGNRRVDVDRPFQCPRSLRFSRRIRASLWRALRFFFFLQGVVPALISFNLKRFPYWRV